MSKTPQDIETSPSTTRRRFLGTGTAVVGGLVAGTAIQAKAQTGGALPIPESMTVPGADVGSEKYGAPSRFEKGVVRSLDEKSFKQLTSAWSKTPLQDLDGIITPNGLFIERHHGGIPDIDPAAHRLMIHGLVDKPMVFSMEDIRRFPAESRIHFIECSGNPFYTTIAAPTAGECVGLLSCAEWTGVTLKTLFNEVGLKPSAKWVIAEGADASALTRSIPLEKCLEDVMLVYSQNGERLRPAQGYPLRVLVPGFEGNMSVKWVRRLHVTDEPIHSREETSKYTDLMPDGTAREFTYFMEAKSIITRPSGTQKIAKGFNEITGVAWTGRGKVAKVEVSTDGGSTWQVAQLQEPVLNKALTRFRFPWVWDGKATIIMSRATDETGYVQPTFEQLKAVRGLNHVYHNNAMQPWRIAENGEVTNAHAKA